MSSLASDAALPPTAVVRRALECARCRDDDTVLALLHAMSPADRRAFQAELRRRRRAGAAAVAEAVEHALRGDHGPTRIARPFTLCFWFPFIVVIVFIVFSVLFLSFVLFCFLVSTAPCVVHYEIVAFEPNSFAAQLNRRCALTVTL